MPLYYFPYFMWKDIMFLILCILSGLIQSQELEVLSLFHLYSLKTKISQCHYIVMTRSLLCYDIIRFSGLEVISGSNFKLL